MSGIPYTSPEEQVLRRNANVDANTEAIQEKNSKSSEINNEIRSEGYTNGEEKAIVRKAIYKLLVEFNLVDNLEFQEFINYNTSVENIKKEVNEGGRRNG